MMAVKGSWVFNGRMRKENHIKQREKRVPITISLVFYSSTVEKPIRIALKTSIGSLRFKTSTLRLNWTLCTWDFLSFFSTTVSNYSNTSLWKCGLNKVFQNTEYHEQKTDFVVASVYFIFGSFSIENFFSLFRIIYSLLFD